MARVLDGIDAFLDQLTAVDILPAFLAVLCQLGRLTCTSQAWRNILVAAFPDKRVRRQDILGAYFAGIGINALIPIRAGDAVRVVLAHRAIPDSSYTTVISSTLVLSIFDITAATLLLLWAVLALDALPGIGDLPELPSFEFGWLLERPLATVLLLAGIFLAGVALAIWIHGHVRDFWGRVKQGFAVVRSPRAYFGSVAIWQAGDWTLRLVTVWFMLDAFDIPQSLENVLLVQVSSSLATLLPLTPGGLGTEQAFLLYVLRGEVPGSQLLAFSVGMRLTLLSTNIVAGFTAIALTLRTFRIGRALDDAEAARRAAADP